MERDKRKVFTEWLALQAQAGDEKAFAQLHSIWAPDFLRLASAQAETRQHADEIAQDAWVAIARGIRRLDDPACFARWAFRILDRRCVDWIRRRQTERKRIEMLQAESIGLAPAEPAGESDELGRLRAAVARLDPQARKLVHLFKLRETLRNRIESMNHE